MRWHAADATVLSRTLVGKAQTRPSPVSLRKKLGRPGIRTARAARHSGASVAAGAGVVAICLHGRGERQARWYRASGTGQRPEPGASSPESPHGPLKES